ncbi:MAG: peroxiredoxin family protein [Pyrinomonadaceae bacterium]
MRILLSVLVIAVSSFAANAQSKSRLAENFSAATMDGKTVELTSLKGKVVLLAFWTTRCPICQSEIPRLNRMAAAYSGKDVVFLGATTDDERNVKSYVQFNPFNFDLLPNSFGLLLKYAERDRDGNLNFGYPAYVLINKAGEIEYRANGWDKVKPLDSAITKLIAK